LRQKLPGELAQQGFGHLLDGAVDKDHIERRLALHALDQAALHKLNLAHNIRQ
jgi:hypothetical protein